MNKELKQLIKNKKEALEKVKQINHAISQHEKKCLLPDIEKKYKGKYFKYFNGCEDLNEKGSWLYIYVKDVQSIYTFYSFTFETDVDGVITINSEWGASPGNCQVEITKEEFMEEYEKTINLSKKLLS